MRTNESIRQSGEQDARRRAWIEELRWKQTKVLDDGYVCLVDVMGDDSAVVQAAKVSYGNDWRFADEAVLAQLNEMKCETCNDNPGLDAYLAVDVDRACQRILSNERGLIRYLMSHHHGTPFEMCEVKWKIRIPMDAHRQLVRHRTASINEYSTRYTRAIDSAQTTLPAEWRKQATVNKQGSAGMITEWPEGYEIWPVDDDGDRLSAYLDEAQHMLKPPEGYASEKEKIDFEHMRWAVYYLSSDHAELECDPDCKAVFDGRHRDQITPGLYLSMIEAQTQQTARDAYEERVDMFDVAREQARKDLPLATYTELYWKCDLRNIFHYLGLRMDAHAQLEVRQYANAMSETVQQLFPLCWEAFVDFQLNAMTLSGPELSVIKEALEGMTTLETAAAVRWPQARSRERDEAIAKFQKLGLKYKTTASD